MANPLPIAHGVPPQNFFNRCFPNLPALQSADADLSLLATTMLDPNARGPINGSKISSGMTYFGQFIDHDLTLDETSQLGVTVDLTTLHNIRTSFFDLDNVYGVNNQFLNAQGLFDIGANLIGEEDLPRAANDIAIIADTRDEENLIISQLQLAFLKFHNRVFADVTAANPSFTLLQKIGAAKQIVTHHYQWLVIHDFLSSICGKYFNRLFDAAGVPIISPQIQAMFPNMSIEFSGALYRMGHSMVRDAYYINKNFDVFPIFSPTLPPPLITAPDLRGFMSLPSNFTMDWSMFFAMPFTKGFQVSERFDTSINQTLYSLPISVASTASLPERNLLRGKTYGLPSGQDLARAFGLLEDEILTRTKGNMIIQTQDMPAITSNDLNHLETVFGDATPLFYYGLKDNHVNGNGEHLGPLSAKVIGETMLSLMLNNPNSIFNTIFTPTAGQYGCVTTGVYRFAEFFTYALTLRPFTANDIIPTAYTNFFDPFENVQFKTATVGHAFMPQVGLAAEIVVQPWRGKVNHQFDPTLALIDATQIEINTVAANAIKFGVDSTLAVVQFLNNRLILAIAQGGAALAPDAPKAAIFPPAVPPPPFVPPNIVMTPAQERANAIFLAQDVAAFMLQPDAVRDAARAQKEITDALIGLVPPAAVSLVPVVAPPTIVIPPTLPPAPTTIVPSPLPVPHGAPTAQNFFNRCFSNLTPLLPADSDLSLLATTMLDPNARGPINGSKVPSGMTYFGQFVDHDLTLDETSQLGTPANINTLPNTRTSFFDLDNVYGVNNQFLNALGLFDIGVNANGEEDLPRTANGIAVLADARDEENLIISQFQLAFLKFHNRVFADITANRANRRLTLAQRIALAKRTVVNHYQWLVLRDFLPSICGKYYARLFTAAGVPIISPQIRAMYPNMSIEFSGALYRMGHSMVRDAYYVNKNFDVFPIFSPTLPPPLITAPDLRGFMPLPSNFTIDWSMFFAMPFTKGFQVSERFDTSINQTLYNLPISVASTASLAERNLLRGKTYGLPSGQDLARAFGLPESEILTRTKGNMIIQTQNMPIITDNDLNHLETIFGDATPLFYYGLKDNHVNGNGEHLGPLSAKVIGETMLILMLNNPTSILNAANRFTPAAGQFGCVTTGVYRFAEFFTYALTLPVFTAADILPTAYTNFFDPFEPAQFTMATVGHALMPQVGLPAEVVIQPWIGQVPHQFDPTLALLNATQIEINIVAANAVTFGVDTTLAIVQFLNNRLILNIAQGGVPLAPDAPKAAIFPPAVPPPPFVPPNVVMTPEQLRANAIFVAQDVAAFMLQPDAVADSARAQQEVNDALFGLVPPPVVIV
jgi:hypothetical protein